MRGCLDSNMKKDYATRFLGKVIKVKIDRPLGSSHPKHPLIYTQNYGFVPNTKAPDGGELDVYVLGIDKPIKEFTGKCIAVIKREDDDDDKLIIVQEGKDISDEEIIKLTNFQERFFKIKIIRKQ